MANIFVYENRLWKEKYVYTEPGIHPFSLNAGEYLLMCHGAKGGAVYNNYHNLGGVAYGVLNLNETKSMYAYVGGDGGDSGNTGFAIGTGGFNGGGNGGKANQDYLNNDNYRAGAGGGGASDIRLHTVEDFAPEISYQPNIPSEYNRVEYIQTDGYVYFDTGYIAKSNTTFVFSTSYITNSSGNTEMAFMGTQSGNNVNPGWAIWMNSAYENIPKIASIYGNMQWVDSSNYENYMTRTMIPSGKVATYQIDKWGTFVNGHPLCYNSDITGDPQNATMILCSNRLNGYIMSNRMYAGKIYYVRAFEYENGAHVLKMELIPCVRLADSVPGFYDTQNQTFITYTQYSSGTGRCTTGSTTTSPMMQPIVTERYYPTIPNAYEQLEYIESSGSVYFDSDYIANENSVMTFRDVITGSGGNESIFGSQIANDTNPGWMCRQYLSSNTVMLAPIYGDMTWNSSYAKNTYISKNYSAMYRVEKNRAFVNLRQIVDNEPTGEPEPNRTILIMACRSADTLAGSPIQGKLYHFRIYEKTENGDVLKHEFVPCKRLSDDVIGLYDTVEDPTTHEHRFLESQTSTTPTAGPSGTFPIVDYDGLEVDMAYSPGEKESLNTRIIVAGGGGGAAVWYNQLDRRSYAGIGGGVYGGFMETFAGSTTRPYATQDSGSGFGNGQDGRDSAYNGNSAQSGASGGGGGWFGGFAMTEPGYYGYNAAGGGGSGYVLTSESWIPDDYMEDYEQYQMTRPFLGSGYAVDSCVRICEPCDAPHTGDKLIVYGFGKSQSIQVPPGEYRLKCWGACGGCTYNSTYAAPGGYAEGKLLLDTPNILYATVGGSGMYYDLGSAYQENVSGYNYVHLLRPDIGYNGGGTAIEYGQILLTADYGNGAYNGAAGGGGTDIRIGSDSLFARVIVAGGSGGSNASSQPLKGGVGGGETGGTGQTGGNGTSPGPGTQAGTPIDPSFNVNGGFGYGGDSVRLSRTNMTAGGGGGGWYGGSSSYRNHSSGQIPPANGGSGYVFTNGSYTPPGYLLTEDFYLTDTVLNQGGSNMPIGVAKIEIDVIETKTVRILCRDSYGVKYFDPDAIPNPKWVNIIPIPSSLTPEVFMQYGSLMMETDNGLADEYDILVYDPDETTSKVSLNVVPNTVQIRNEITTDIDITDMKPRLEFDPVDFDINITANRQSLVSGAKIKTTFDVTKKGHNDAKAKIYYVTYSDGK